MDGFFKIKEIFPITSKVNEDDEDSDELSEVDRMTNNLEEGYEMKYGYWDLVTDPVMQMHPRCVIKKGKTNRKYYTQVVFQSGNFAYAACDPDELKKLIEEYVSNQPKSEA